jgi:anti-sigma regulatory factor (Ser/Thr protein kinase)
VLAVNELAENTIVHTEAGGDGTSIRLHMKHEREPST